MIPASGTWVPGRHGCLGVCVAWVSGGQRGMGARVAWVNAAMFHVKRPASVEIVEWCWIVPGE